jgi:triacylglycerol lipase
MSPDAGPSAYYGRDPALYTERSSVNGLLKTRTPLMVIAAELDPPLFVEQLNLLKDSLCKSEHGCVRSLLLPQHSHMSEVYSINTPDTRLTDEILEFVKTGR